jgi:peptidylprolyl isomerase
VATSRRRERELARRRFERRRQAELERRARAKKRNTVIGASIGTVLVLGGVIGLIVGLAGGSNKKATAHPASSLSPSASPASQSQPAPKTCAKISPNPPANGEPTVPDVTGKAPTKLVSKDLKVGHGAGAKSGDTLTVKYIGVSCATGKVFDASYTDGSPKQEISFPLGQGQVIPGWDKGLVGIKVGGVRELVIPGPLAYATNPQGAPTFPNDTLIFLVTAEAIK